MCVHVRICVHLCSPLCLSLIMCAQIDRGVLGMVGHTGADGSSSADRQSRYGTWTTKCGECLWFGRVGASAETIVADLIIDDGVPSRGHRLCIFDAKYAVASARVGVHATFGCMVVVEFAGEFVSDDALVAARQVDTRKRALNAFK